MEEIKFFNQITQKEDVMYILNFHTDGLSNDDLENMTIEEYAEEAAKNTPVFYN